MQTVGEHTQRGEPHYVGLRVWAGFMLLVSCLCALVLFGGCAAPPSALRPVAQHNQSTSATLAAYAVEDADAVRRLTLALCRVQYIRAAGDIERSLLVAGYIGEGERLDIAVVEQSFTKGDTEPAKAVASGLVPKETAIAALTDWSLLRLTTRRTDAYSALAQVTPSLQRLAQSHADLDAVLRQRAEAVVAAAADLGEGAAAVVAYSEQSVGTTDGFAFADAVLAELPSGPRRDAVASLLQSLRNSYLTPATP